MTTSVGTKCSLTGKPASATDEAKLSSRGILRS